MYSELYPATTTAKDTVDKSVLLNCKQLLLPVDGKGELSTEVKEKERTFFLNTFY
jgi:hypothetical protein